MDIHRSGRGVGSGVSVAMAGLVVALLGVSPALAGVGVAVVPDLPRTVGVGQTGLNGTLTITNANTSGEDEDSNIVSSILFIPSCGARDAWPGCPGGAEDPGAFAIDSLARGRAGTACAGAEFTVTVSDKATGEVTFEPPEGFITLGPAAGSQA